MLRRDGYSMNDGYFKTVHIGGASTQETEILAFGLCNVRLGKADGGRARIEALNKNHTLWSMLVRDLSSDGNQLPETLKRSLVDLGFWSMSYSVAAMSRKIPLQPLIDVNQNIMDGLRLQNRAVLNTPCAEAMAITAI